MASYVTYAQDTDLDGILNVSDLDDDNDGILDIYECGEYVVLQLENNPTRLNGTLISSVTSVSNGDVILIENTGAFLDGTQLNVQLVIVNVSNGAEYDPSGGMISIVGHNPSNGDYLSFYMQVLDASNGDILTIEGEAIFKDLDSESGDDFAEVLGVSPSDNVSLGANIVQLNYLNGGPGPGGLYFGVNPATTGIATDWDDEINVSDSNQDHWLRANYPFVDQINITFGVTGSANYSSGTRDLVLSDIGVRRLCDTDLDGIANSYDLDSDDDGCDDVIEAGHLDPDSDGELGIAPIVVDSQGLVISDANGSLNYGIDSYSGTNSSVLMAGQVFTIDSNPQDQSISNGDDATFTVAVSTSGLTFLWEESSDNGSTFSTVTDGGRYSGSTTESLTISNVNNGMNGNQYRVTVLDVNNICNFIQSSVASLFTRPTITINDTSADEGSNMTFTITASSAVSQNVNFTISYTNNTTTSADYSGPTTVTMASGSTSVTFNVLAIDDDWVEQTLQDFTATISTNSNQVNISDDEGVGTIVDTDVAYVVGGNFDIAEGEVIQYRLFLSTDTNSGGQQYVGIEDAYTVDFATEISTVSSSPATDGSDFNSFSTTATFPVGSIAGTEIFIAVPTTEDTLVEPSEEFNGVKSRNSAEATKYGSGPSRVSINTERSSLRIHDDDTATITLEDISVNEDVGTTNYTFTLAGQTRDAFDISYQTNNNTADSATDYTSTTSTVSFNGTDGEVRSIVLSITDDLILESTEDFTIVPSYTGVIPSLANAVAQNIVFANNPGTVTINDNDLEAVDDYTTVYHAQVLKTIDVLSNDNYGYSGPAATNALQIVTAPSNGTISINDNGIGRKASAKINEDNKEYKHDAKGSSISIDRIKLNSLIRQNNIHVKIIDKEENDSPSGTIIQIQISKPDL